MCCFTDLVVTVCPTICAKMRFIFSPKRENCFHIRWLWFLWMLSFVSWTKRPLLSSPNPWLRPHGQSSLMTQLQDSLGAFINLACYFKALMCSLVFAIQICSTIKRLDTENPGKQEMFVICDQLIKSCANTFDLILTLAGIFSTVCIKTTLSLCARVLCAIMVVIHYCLCITGSDIRLQDCRTLTSESCQVMWLGVGQTNHTNNVADDSTELKEGLPYLWELHNLV